MAGPRVAEKNVNHWIKLTLQAVQGPNLWDLSTPPQVCPSPNDLGVTTGVPRMLVHRSCAGLELVAHSESVPPAAA